MKFIGLRKLNAFGKDHHSTSSSISTWKSVTEAAKWHRRGDVILDFPKAKIIKGNRARFEISGKKYRLICEIDYGEQVVEVRWIGSHAEYDKIDATTI